jgi:hypothetical protein
LNGSATPAAQRSRLGPVGLIGLLVAALILGLFVYRERTPDLALEVTKFPKEFKAPAAEIVFFVRFDSDAATVEMVGRDQVVARTLADPIPLKAEVPMSCLWDGLDDEGHPVEPGRYRLRVTLPEEDREMVFPRRLNVGVDDGGGDGNTPASDPCEDPVPR